MSIRRMLLPALGVVAALLAVGTTGTAPAQAATSGGPGVLAAVEYRISVTTSDIEDAGTDGTVEIRLRGTLAWSNFMTLDSNLDNFERNTTNVFDRVVTDLGTIELADVRFTRSGDSPAWHLAHITVSASGRPDAVFPAHRWLGATQTINLPVAVSPRTYTIQVTTSDIENAGTDGTVEVRLRGGLGSSVFFHLDNEGVDNFERKSTNRFVRVIDSVGFLSSVDVRFDPSGGSPAWHLAHISVAVSSGGTFFFPCHCWFEFPSTVNLPIA